MGDPFVHLRVASAYSLRYGASQPATLVERAAEYDMDLLALTDRDGLYGAVRFVQACRHFGIGPVIGVDLPLRAEASRRGAGRSRRTPARGGQQRDRGLRRLVVLAGSRRGWSALCRLVSASHVAGDRGQPVCTIELVGRYAADDLVVMLGADSAFGSAVAAERPDQAEQELRRWSSVVAPHQLVVAVSHLYRGGSGVGSLTQAGRMLALADRERVPAVLTNLVRMSDRHLAPTVDVLDAARRLVALDRRHVDASNAEGYLKSGKEMRQVAEEVAQRAGRPSSGADRLLAETRALAVRCTLHPIDDLGLGSAHLPELVVPGPGGERLSQRTRSGRAAAQRLLQEHCEAGLRDRYGEPSRAVADRLAEELAVVERLGYATYFLTVADVVATIKQRGIRCAARGSGAGSMINYVLGISGVEPIGLGLIMERFLSVRRRSLPDIDLDVESARRPEVYQMILTRFGAERVAGVAMMETYRVRHAVRDVGAALSMAPGEVDAIAKAFPHVRASEARAVLRDLPELRSSGLAERRLDLLFGLVQTLDGLPRHIALHPCGVLLSDATLLDRTPVESSLGGFPMSQFDKDDVSELGLLKLDVLGIRMQSAMAHALSEIRRLDGPVIDLERLPFDDPTTFDLVQRAQTLGCFQIDSPGQRELVGSFSPESFNDLVIDLSLFRPGPVQGNMITPFLEARHGWSSPRRLHRDLAPILAETAGVVVFHEQVIKIIATLAGCRLDEGEELRRALVERLRTAEIEAWVRQRAAARGYPVGAVEDAWRLLRSFGAFGFCKAHAAAFALTTYQTAWLKAHYPAQFLAGVLTHDPGMYPRRVIVDEARRLGVAVLGLDVNASGQDYRVERVDGDDDTTRLGIRVPLAEVQGISDAEVTGIVAGQPYQSLPDLWHRAAISHPVAERLVLAGAFDRLYGIGAPSPLRRRRQVTRRDLLLGVSDLQRADRVDVRAAGLTRRPASPERHVQLPLELGLTGDAELAPSGLRELTAAERVGAELSVLGIDASQHVMAEYLPMLRSLGVTFADRLLQARTSTELLVAGVKVITKTPPVRSGRRVIFVTLDDSTGPVDAAFFDDVQGDYARRVFASDLLLVRGTLRRTGRRGVSVRATGAWDLPGLLQCWQSELDRTARPAGAAEAVRASLGGD